MMPSSPCGVPRKGGWLSRHTLKQFLAFIVAGTVVVGADAAVFFSLVWLAGLHYQIANAAGVAAGCVLDYFVCRRWVFSRSGRSHRSEFGMFIVVSLSTLLLTSLVLALFLNFGLLHATMSFLSAKEQLVVAKGVSIAAATVWDFVLKKVIVFQESPSRSEPSTNLSTGPGS